MSSSSRRRSPTRPGSRAGQPTSSRSRSTRRSRRSRSSVVLPTAAATTLGRFLPPHVHGFGQVPVRARRRLRSLRLPHGRRWAAHSAPQPHGIRPATRNSTSLSYTVLAWEVRGFYQPTDMGDVWNTVKNGATVPLKFEVFAGHDRADNPFERPVARQGPAYGVHRRNIDPIELWPPAARSSARPTAESVRL